MATTTLVLGGGFGGLSTARALRSRLPDGHRVVLVDRKPDFLVGAGKTWVMLGERRADEIAIARSRLLPAGIERLEDEVVAIDPARRSARLASGVTLAADHLVIALGAAFDPAVVPGLERAHSFYDLEGAIRLAPVLDAFTSGRIVLLIARTPFMCPPAPYEAALLLHDFFERRGIRDRVSLHVATPEGAPMATAGPAMGALVREELERRGIEYRPGHVAAAVEDEGRRVRFQNGEAVECDLMIAIPPHRAPHVVVEAGLAPAGGWIAVEPRTLAVPGQDGVFAIGDVTAVPLPGRFRPEVPLVLPKAGVMAAAEGEVVARGIAARVLGGEAGPDFAGEGSCYLEVGEGKAIRAEGRFFAEPHPLMTHAMADAAQLADKHRWAAEWLTPVA